MTKPMRIFSGIQPTGNIHLGNYLGAIKHWATFSQEATAEMMLFAIVDMHAITIEQNPQELQDNTRTMMATLLACGINTEKAILFAQSSVPEHAELAWIMNCIARIGWLNRMTQFKEKAGKNKENSSVGLYVYPNLMAADILAYQATHVPVGDDQKQHLELARDIALRFNRQYKIDFFTPPEPLIQDVATRIMSLADGAKKMSKSDALERSRIHLTDDADTIAQKIMRAKTDSQPFPQDMEELKGRPEVHNLITIHHAISNTAIENILATYGGKTMESFKKDLAEQTIAHITPIGKKAQEMKEDKAFLDKHLKIGQEKARSISSPIVAEAKRIVGFINL